MNRPELREGDVLTRRYLLQERIATGGMSVIWRAFDQSLQRSVAIKVLDGSLGDDNPGRELMRREARATAQLIHPDAIEVYDYGETVTNGGRLASFVVMRLLEGRSLADRITAEGPLPWTEAVEIAAGLAKVLAAAHDRGIVHRDVTPENVLLADDGPKLLDFGIAAFIGESDDQLVADFGTPPYVAPERLKGTTADPAVDVYALGVLLFEMLTGSLPYPEKTWEAIEAARRDGPPPVPEARGLPQEVADLCRRCLSPDPADRPSARAVAAALAAVKKPPGPRGTGWGAAAVGAAALGGILWLTQTGGPELGAFAAMPSPSAYTQVTASPQAQVKAAAGPQHTVAPVADPVRTEGPPRQRPSPSAGLKVAKKDRQAGRTVSRPDTSATREAEVAALPLADTAASMSVDTAIRQFALLVDGAEATRDIDDDVALDLKQVLRNAVDNGQGLSTVRTKIEVRYREGRLPLPLKGELLTALDRVEAALIQASDT
ncbi:MAG: serine/threonine protein kinase [Microbispora sp.]|nr:serine/threonine protein kinase [Microbispora sp.]